MKFTQIGNTEQCEENGTHNREYWFARYDAPNSWRLKGDNNGDWSIAKQYSTGFILHLKF